MATQANSLFARDTVPVLGQPRSLQYTHTEPPNDYHRAVSLLGIRLPLNRSPYHPGIRRLRLQHLPDDVLNQIMEEILPYWVSMRCPALGPSWTATDMREPLDIAESRRTFIILRQTCRNLHRVSTPFLYRFIQIGDVRTLLKLWTTLLKWAPERAALIRHLVMGIRVDEYAVYSKCEVFVRDSRLAVAPPSFQRPLSYAVPPPPLRPREPFVWANGQVLVPADLAVAVRDPVIALKIFFDIVGRAKQLLSLSMIPPNQDNVHQSLLFRDAIGQVASPTIIQPTQYLQNLRTITIQVTIRPRNWAYKYLVYPMPTLQRLTLVHPDYIWYLNLDPRPSATITTALLRVRSLSIARSKSDCSFLDLRLGLEILPNLTHLGIDPPTGFTQGRYRHVHHIKGLTDLNTQIHEHGQNIRQLTLEWVMGTNSRAQMHLGPERCLSVLPSMANLVHLVTSTQLLFGTLHCLEDYLEPANGSKSLNRFLRSLPESLQLITLTEHWSDSELAPPVPYEQDDIEDPNDDDGWPEVLHTWHEGGDWMEQRWRYEEARALRAHVRQLRDWIETPHDRALLGLMLAMGKVWLAGNPLRRLLELWPQWPEFYRNFTHWVVVDPDEGVRGLHGERRQKDGRERFDYKFVDEIYFRGLDAEVRTKRP